MEPVAQSMTIPTKKSILRKPKPLRNHLSKKDKAEEVKPG